MQAKKTTTTTSTTTSSNSNSYKSSNSSTKNNNISNSFYFYLASGADVAGGHPVLLHHGHVQSPAAVGTPASASRTVGAGCRGVGVAVDGGAAVEGELRLHLHQQLVVRSLSDLQPRPLRRRRGSERGAAAHGGVGSPAHWRPISDAVRAEGKTGKKQISAPLNG